MSSTPTTLRRLREALQSCLTDTADSLDDPRRQIMLKRRIEECDAVLEGMVQQEST